MESNESFRNYLQNELAKRAKKNARFSIRAFARHLGIEPSSLAQVLSGKRNLTDQMCLRLAEPLKLSSTKLRLLMKRDGIGKSSDSFSQFRRLEEDEFRVISEWHYYAILELTRTDAFKGNINWIAASLEITAAEVRAAVERLKRLGYLKIDATGKWIDALGSATNLGNERSAHEFREYQSQILKKASVALETVAYEERVQSSMTFVGSRERIAEAKRRIHSFIEELDEFMKTGPSRDEVYNFSVSLYPVSKNRVKVKRSIP